MIEDIKKAVSSANQVNRLLNFEFAKGGTLEFSLGLENIEEDQPLGLYFCTQGELEDKLERQRLTFDEFCNKNPFESLQCEHGVKSYLNSTQTSFNLNWTAEKQLWMWLVSINCNQKAYSLAGNFVAVNPGGEYLSLNLVPFKPLFIILAGLWFALVLMWTFHWFQYRFFNVKLQSFLTVLPLIQMGSCILWEYYYKYCSETGYQPPIGVVWCVVMMSCTATTIVFLALMYVAEGWGVLRKTLGQRKQIWTFAASYWASSLLMNLYPSFVFVLVFFYLLILRHIFRQHSQTMRLLKNQYDEILQQFPENAEQSPCYEKMVIYRSFQRIVVIFVAIDIIFRWWARSLLQATPWVSTILQHAMLIVLAGALGWTFRLKPFYPHFFMLTDFDQEENNNLDVEEPLLHGNPLIRRWRPGMGAPEGFKHEYHDWLEPGAGQLALVENTGAKRLEDRWALAIPTN